MMRFCFEVILRYRLGIKVKMLCVLWTFVYFCVCFCAERPDDVAVLGNPVHLSEKTTQSVLSVEPQDNESEEDEWYDAPSAIMEPEVCLVPGVGHCGVFVLLRVIEEKGVVNHELCWWSHLMCADCKPDFPQERPEKCRWGFLPMPWIEHCCGGFLSRRLLPPLTISEDSVDFDPAMLKEPVSTRT